MEIPGRRRDTADGAPRAPGVLAGHKVRNGLILALTISTVSVVVILFVTMNHSTWQAVSRIDPLFFLAAVALMAVKWGAACFRTDLLVHASGGRLPFGKVVRSVLGGSFVGSVTPFQAGGIPTEIFFLYSYGIPAGKATAVVSTGAAMSTLQFILAIPIVLAVTASQIKVSFGVRTILIAAGVFAFFFFLAVVYSMREPSKVATSVRKHAPGFLKRRENFDDRVDGFTGAVAEFSESLRQIMRGDKRLLAGAILLTFTFWATGFMVAPVILWGLGYPGLFWKAMLAQLVVSCILPFLPAPGGSGFAESAFAGVFAIFVPGYLVGFVNLSWRFFTYYMMLVVQGVFFVLALRDSTSRAELVVAGVEDAEDSAGDEAR